MPHFESLQLFANCYRGKRVLVTGHTGFKGAWLTHWLMEMGAEVYGYALPEGVLSPGAVPVFECGVYSALGLSRRLHGEVLGDLADRTTLVEFLNSAAPDFIFHLAAQPLVRRSYIEPLQTIYSNFVGTAHLLEALRQRPWLGRCSVVIVTSDKCYENRNTLEGYKETDPMGGSDVYSMTKGACELLVNAYRKSFFSIQTIEAKRVSLATGRAGNVFGGGDYSEDRIIPDCVRALAAGEDVILRNPDSIRPWQHVLESVSGYLTLGKYLSRASDERFETGWNFGPSDLLHKTVQELVTLFREYWCGVGALSESISQIKVTQDIKFAEANLLRLDVTKARRELRWKSVWSLEESIKYTVDWYKAFEFKKQSLDSSVIDSMVAISNNQIHQYLKQAKFVYE